MLYGILFNQKSLPYKSAFRNAEKFKGGGSYRPPKKRKKIIFLRFLGACNSPPLNFSAFLRANQNSNLNTFGGYGHQDSQNGHHESQNGLVLFLTTASQSCSFLWDGAAPACGFVCACVLFDLFDLFCPNKC